MWPISIDTPTLSLYQFMHVWILYCLLCMCMYILFFVCVCMELPSGRSFFRAIVIFFAFFWQWEVSRSWKSSLTWIGLTISWLNHWGIVVENSHSFLKSQKPVQLKGQERSQLWIPSSILVWNIQTLSLKFCWVHCKQEQKLEIMFSRKMFRSLLDLESVNIFSNWSTFFALNSDLCSIAAVVTLTPGYLLYKMKLKLLELLALR